MLTLPVYEQIGDITIYADHEKDYVFYPLPNIPTLRFGTDGKPIFTFLKYREASENLNETTDRGGGYVQFDSQFKNTQESLDKVREKLQGRVDRKYRQKDQNPPDVILAAPTYRSGTVQLITFEPKAGGIIEYIAGEGPCSQVGSNIASFAMELSQRGASLLWDAFQMATLPLAVRYNLDFLARVPALEMHIWLHARQLHTYYEEITKEIDDDVWGDDEKEYKRTLRESFAKHQVGGVDILDWPAEFSGSPDGEKFKKEMIEWGWDMFDEAFQDALGDRFEKSTETGGVGDFRKVTRDYVESHVTDINIHFKRNSVILWNIVPQATLQGFLDTPSPTGKKLKKSDFFKEISLDDEWFRLLRVNCRCNANFTDDPIFAVKVHIEYGDAVEEFVFQDNEKVHTFKEFVKPSIGNDYKYWTEITYKNRDRKFKSPEATTNETELILSFGALGYLKFDIIAGDIDYKYVQQVQVHIRYGDPSNNVPLEEKVVQLDEKTTQATFERIIWAPVVKPYEYKVVYFLTDGQQVERGWKSSSQTPLIVNDIFEERLIVKFIPTGSFDRMSRILVDLAYDDEPHDYHVTKSLSMSSLEDELTWNVPLWDEGPSSFRYRTIVSYKDGHSETSEWHHEEGSTTLNVGEVFSGYLEVMLVTDLIDFSKVRLVKVSLSYEDDENNISETEDFIFTPEKSEGDSWKLPIKNTAHKEYQVNALYFMEDGTRKMTPDAKTKDETLILEIPAA